MDVKKRNSRSMIERAKSIFEFIDHESEPFHKSRLKKVGLSPATAEKWLDLIVFIQDQPKIRLVKTSNNIIVEKIENKFMSMSIKAFRDQSLPPDVRAKSLEDYIKSQFIQERISDIEGTRICNECGEKRLKPNSFTNVCDHCIKKYTTN